MSKKMTIELCDSCAVALEEGYILTRIACRVDNKIICACCCRRRYGATYEATPRRQKESK